MRSEFEKTLKQHRDALTDELVKLGNYRQVQLVEWDIERNETDYEFYFDGAWNAQQSKVDELQKKLDEYIFVAESIDEMYEREIKKNDELQKRVDAAQKLIDDWNCGGVNLFDLLDELEQALKGEHA